jgi:hypothetical protein
MIYQTTTTFRILQVNFDLFCRICNDIKFNNLCFLIEVNFQFFCRHLKFVRYIAYLVGTHRIFLVSCSDVEGFSFFLFTCQHMFRWYLELCHDRFFPNLPLHYLLITPPTFVMWFYRLYIYIGRKRYVKICNVFYRLCVIFLHDLN